MNKTILVTGASGFVGHLLCAELAKHGYTVRAVLRASGNLEIAGCETVKISDIGSNTEWDDALRGISTVIHLAARVHVMREEAVNPLAEFRKVNVEGTEHLARIAAARGVKRMVYVSSIKVNGEVTHGDKRFTEVDTPAPQDTYGVSKFEAEQVLHRVAQETGLEVVIVRPPLVYGPGVKGNFAQMMKAVDKGMPLPLASVNNWRSLVFAGNLVDALIRCATHPAAAGQTYLISDGEDVSTPELLRSLASAMGAPNRLFSFPPFLLRGLAYMFNQSMRLERLTGSLRVDGGKIRRELNWAPPYSLRQGLQATAEWYRAERA